MKGVRLNLGAILSGVLMFVLGASVMCGAFSKTYAQGVQPPTIPTYAATIFNAEVGPAIDVKVVPNPVADRFMPDPNSYGKEWTEKDAKGLDPRPTRTYHLWLEAHNHTNVDQTGTLQIAIIRSISDNLTMLGGRGLAGDPEDIGLIIWRWEDDPSIINSLASHGEWRKYAFGGADSPLTVYADSSMFFLVGITLGERMRPDSLRIHAWMEPPSSARTSD